MPKKNPQTAIGGERNAPSGDRLALLIANAITENEDLLAEISDLLPRKQWKPGGTDINSDILRDVSKNSDLGHCEHFDLTVPSDLSESGSAATFQDQSGTFSPLEPLMLDNSFFKNTKV